MIPFSLSAKWNLISRWITPIVYQPIPVPQPPAPPSQITGVYGDIVETETHFFTPAHPGKIILGLGPSFSFPTATAYPAKTGTWAGGGSFVVLATPGPFVLGSLFVQLSPMTDSGGEPKVNNFLWQYFVNYNFGKGLALSTSGPIITANWRASAGNVWTVPFGGGVGRITKLGFQPVNLTAQLYGNAVHPSGASTWSLRMQVVLLFPRLSPDQQKALLQMKLKQIEQQQQQTPAPKK